MAAQYGNFDLEMEVLAFRASGVKNLDENLFSIMRMKQKVAEL